MTDTEQLAADDLVQQSIADFDTPCPTIQRTAEMCRKLGQYLGWVELDVKAQTGQFDDAYRRAVQALNTAARELEAARNPHARAMTRDERLAFEAARFKADAAKRLGRVG